MLTKYLTLIYTHLKWVLHFLLYYPFDMLHVSQPPMTIGAELSTFHYESSDEHVDCAVCLHTICEADGDIRVLRCEHVFHKGCLETWFGFKNATCPLCRGSAATRPITHSGAEVLLFQFCSVRNENRDTWWLR
uniref:RING-H2 finger protein ATL2L n=1 Tax=Cajanus cajan TaxID=3821 RepID=A0A151SZQ1_CAJCA|nr:RING-H2 finger protein ATL2L [Cajanus cajan]